MKRIAAAALIALVVGLTTAGAAPGWAREVGLDVWNWDTEVAHLRAEEAVAADLRAEQAERVYRAAAIDTVIARLVDGRLTLAAATAALEQITLTRPDLVIGLRCAYPAATTDHDAHTLWAIERAHCAVRDDPSRLAEATARLDAEHREATDEAPSPQVPR